MNSLRRRLARLESRVPRAPTVQEIEKMSEAELFRRVGLPPNPSRQEIDALILAIEEDLARTASHSLSGSSPC